MIRRPRRFFVQTLLITFAALFAAQILSAVVIGLLVIRPQIKRLAGIVAQSVEAMTVTADKLGVEDRAEVIRTLNQTGYLDVYQGTGAPPLSGRQPRPIEKYFMQALVDAMVLQDELEWRTTSDGRIWTKIAIGPENYWFATPINANIHTELAIGATTLVAALVSLLVAGLAQYHLVKPLSALTEKVKSYRSGDKPIPAIRNQTIEIQELARGFHTLTAQLSLIDQERAFMLAGISHDVRTPLAKLRLAIEMLAKNDAELGDIAHRQVEEIDRVLSQFVTFARGFESEAVTPYDLEALVRSVIELRAREGREFSLQVDPALAAPLILSGRPESLRRGLLNLTENATLYGESPFEITISREAEHLVLRVCDAGPGIADDQKARMLLPFMRGDASRSGGQDGKTCGSGSGITTGTGLGLAITQLAARAQFGDFRLDNNQPKGLCATILLPWSGTNENTENQAV